MRSIIEKKRLGKTNLLVPAIGWGASALGNMPEAFGYIVSESEAATTLVAALATSIKFVDTANIYGQSEERVGKALRAMPWLSDNLIIATKADRDKQTNSFSAKRMRESIQESCVRLGLNRLPLVYLHDPEYDPDYANNRDVFWKEMLDPDGTVAALEALKKEGVIENLGISGGPIDMLVEFVKTGRFDVVLTHNQWNLLYQTANPLIKTARALGMGVINAGIYASGILVTGPGKNARALYQPPSKDIEKRVRNIAQVCKKYNVPLGAAALQFSLNDLRIHSTIVGVANPYHVKETLRLATLPISEQFWEEVKQFTITSN